MYCYCTLVVKWPLNQDDSSMAQKNAVPHRTLEEQHKNKKKRCLILSSTTCREKLSALPSSAFLRGVRKIRGTRSKGKERNRTHSALKFQRRNYKLPPSPPKKKRKKNCPSSKSAALGLGRTIITPKNGYHAKNLKKKKKNITKWTLFSVHFQGTASQGPLINIIIFFYLQKESYKEPLLINMEWTAQRLPFVLLEKNTNLPLQQQ